MFAVSRQVPDLDFAAFVGRGQHARVGMVGHGKGSSRMAAQHPRGRAVTDIPQPHRAVRSRCRHLFAVRPERQPGNPRFMTHEEVSPTAARDIIEDRSSIQRRGQAAAVGIEGHTRHGLLIRVQAQRHSLGTNIPQEQLTAALRPASGGEPAAVGTEGDAVCPLSTRRADRPSVRPCSRPTGSSSGFRLRTPAVGRRD